jgi:hypothetical protein
MGIIGFGQRRRTNKLVRKLDLSWAGGSARRRASADGWVTVGVDQAVAAWSSPVSGLMGWMVTL